MIDQVIDISHHQTQISFPELAKGGIKGVFHKATQGVSEIDPLYHVRSEEARSAGLMWGAYHFGVGEGGVEQANHFVDVVKPDARTLLVLDFEPNTQGPTMTLAQAEEFVARIHELTGRYPGLYSGSLVKELLGEGKSELLALCWLWLSEYGPEPHIPSNWPVWTMWQYTSSGNVLGAGLVDRDRFNGNLEELCKLWGYPISP